MWQALTRARAELEIVDFLKRPHYRRLGGKIPRACARRGSRDGQDPPGQGRRGGSRRALLQLGSSDFVEMFVGVGRPACVTSSQAQAKAPSIIFIDELDALGKARGISPLMGGHDRREQTLNQLLAEMDGFDTQKGVILLAATNRPEILDPRSCAPAVSTARWSLIGRT